MPPKKTSSLKDSNKISKNNTKKKGKVVETQSETDTSSDEVSDAQAYPHTSCTMDRDTQ